MSNEDGRMGGSWIPTTPNLCRTSSDPCREKVGCCFHGEIISRPGKSQGSLLRLPLPQYMHMLKSNNASFGELLARAHAGIIMPQVEDEATTAAAYAPPCVQGGSSSYPRPFFDLNMVPESNPEEPPAGPVFEPITPEKSVKRPDSAMQQHMLSIDDLNSAKLAQVEGLDKGEEKSINHQFRASVSSTLLQENHKPDKGSTNEADASKTLQRKPKKHRPKVISEGKPRANRKQNVESSGTTPVATPVKRKPGRPKANSNTPCSEGEGNRIDSREATPRSADDTQPAKRTYSRRNKINKPDDTVDKGIGEPTNANSLRKTRSSCRKFLNFDQEGQVNGGGFFDCQPFEKSITETRCDTAVANELACPSDQELQDQMARQTQRAPSSSRCNNTDLVQSFQQLAGNGPYRREKHQAFLSDGLHDKGTNNVQTMINPSDHLTARSLSGSCFAPEREVRGLKRNHVDAPVETGFSDTNAMGIVGTFCPGADENDGNHGWCIPAKCKRKRTEKRHNVLPFSLPNRTTSSDNYGTLERHHVGDSTTKPSTSAANQGPSRAQHNSINLLADCVTNATHDGRKFLGDLLVAATTETVKRKRSKVHTRVRDLKSLMDIGNQMPTYRGVPAMEAQTCMEALVAYNFSMNSIPKTKKRSKRSTVSNGFVQNWDFATQSMGSPLAITWKSPFSVDSITEQFSELDLNAEISEESARNLSLAYRMHYQEQHSLVPYQSHGTIVPFDSSFDQNKKRRPRAKVDLDDETTRVWNLLLENINSEGINGEDDEKARWWEEERRIFKGRSDSFIARMHLVQGDRRFSPWKGSVVDSAVGVFLTQNVSDHLSSSAFMSLVSRYPAKSENHLAGSTEVQEPDSCMLGPDTTFGSEQKIPDNSFCGEESSVLLEIGNDDVREETSKKSPGNSSDVSISRNNLGGQSSDAFKQVPDMSHESCCFTDKSTSPVRDGRDKEDTISSQTLEISSQSSAYSSTAHTTERNESCLRSAAEESTALTQSNDSSTFSEELLQVAAATVQYIVCDKETEGEESGQVAKYRPLSEEPTFCHSCDSEILTTVDLSQEISKVSYGTIENETFIAATCGSLSEAASQTAAVITEDEPQFSRPNLRSFTEVQVETEKMVGNIAGLASTEGLLVDNQSETKEVSSDNPLCSQNLKDIGESSTKADECTKVNSIENDVNYDPRGKTKQGKAKGEKTEKVKKKIDWDRLREHAKKGGKQRGKTPNTMDSVDWDAVRSANVHEVAETIKERGMNNVLAGRIKDFLDRVVEDHGSIDLEWLRDVPPDSAKEYLLSINGLGLKSVECIRLLTLHHLAFPVDTNVGRIAVRLGWVPLQPLPESLQLHLLELYPMLESIQKYLWPRLCKLDQKTLYELHYQMITFGKVFCTKSKPNCNACPMRGECRHFASAFASARLCLPAPEEKGIVTTTDDTRTAAPNVQTFTNPLQLPSNIMDAEESIVSNCQPIIEVPPSPEPPTIEEVPATPGQSNIHEPDIEDAFIEDPDEIPTIQLNMEEFTHNLQKIMEQTQDGDMTKALVALTAEAASIPVPKLKNVSRLRTEHQVYELPDSHPLLEGLDKREPDDPCPYMLAIWTPGETVNSVEPPKRKCNSLESEKLCNDETCSSCNSVREATLDTVRGTLLIPCRTAMRGSFPLNGTYFQVNEVFADHESSLIPMNIPRQWLWNLPRRTVYFGTSIPTIFKGLSTEGIQYCFWRGFVCVRGFERKTRAPRPLIARLHFPASHKGKAKIDENQP